MNKIERKKLESFVRSDGFDMLLRLFGEKSSGWRNDSLIKMSSEFDTLWNMALNKGKIDGCQELLDDAMGEYE